MLAQRKVKQIRKVKPEATKKTRGRRGAAKRVQDEDQTSVAPENEEHLFMQVAPDKMQLLVDSHVPQRGQYRVYSEGSTTYNTSLMLADLAHNCNKFYIVQLLQSILDEEAFVVFTRWGRVGFDGQSVCYPFDDVGLAAAFYEAKCREKAGGGYTEIGMALQESDSDNSEIEVRDKHKNSKLDPRVQVLLLATNRNSLASYLIWILWQI